MNPTLPSYNLPFLATPHSDPSGFTQDRLSGRRLAQGPRKKYKQSQHGGVKGEESPPPTTVGTHFRLGLHVKSHSPGGWWGVERNSLFWHGAAGLCHKKSMLLQVTAPPWPSVSIKLNAKQMTRSCRNKTFGLCLKACLYQNIFMAGWLIKMYEIHQMNQFHKRQKRNWFPHSDCVECVDFLYIL